MSRLTDPTSFIERMHDADPTGDGGRFQRHKNGQHALAEVCCLDAERTLYFVDAINQIIVPQQGDTAGNELGLSSPDHASGMLHAAE